MPEFKSEGRREGDGGRRGGGGGGGGGGRVVEKKNELGEKLREGRGGKKKRGLVVFRPRCSPPLLLLSLTAASTWNSTERARTSHAFAQTRTHINTHRGRRAGGRAGNSLPPVLRAEGSVGLAVEEKWRVDLQRLGRERLV